MKARTRMIKPEFFNNDFLGERDPLARLLFIGLLGIADKEGRLEDKPIRIKALVLPYDNCDVDALLDSLVDEEEGVIERYSVDGKKYIQIVNFSKHQNVHPNEAKSVIPPKGEEQANVITSLDQSQQQYSPSKKDDVIKCHENDPLPDISEGSIPQSENVITSSDSVDVESTEEKKDDVIKCHENDPTSTSTSCRSRYKSCLNSKYNKSKKRAKIPETTKKIIKEKMRILHPTCGINFNDAGYNDAWVVLSDCDSDILEQEFDNLIESVKKKKFKAFNPKSTLAAIVKSLSARDYVDENTGEDKESYSDDPQIAIPENDRERRLWAIEESLIGWPAFNKGGYIPNQSGREDIMRSFSRLDAKKLKDGLSVAKEQAIMPFRDIDSLIDYIRPFMMKGVL